MQYRTRKVCRNVCRRGPRANVSVWHVTNRATDIYF